MPTSDSLTNHTDKWELLCHRLRYIDNWFGGKPTYSCVYVVIEIAVKLDP